MDDQLCAERATVESTTNLGSAWKPIRSVFTTTAAGQTQMAVTGGEAFFRLQSADVSGTPAGAANLGRSYSVLTTLAGNGAGSIDGSNYWRSAFEGGPATNASLSRPHFAMSDDVGNVFIVDKDSHSVLKVTPNGRIHTVAGTHVAGDNGDGPAPGTNTQLNFPNGLWVRGDGTVYVLDTGNGKVRRLGTNGVMTTLFTVNSGIVGGRGLWVSPDESLTYFCSGQELRRRMSGKITTLNNNFTDLGNIALTPRGDILATDRGDNRVYLVDATGGQTGGRTRLVGNGSTNAVVNGALALHSGLAEVRGVWPLPTGGYFLATHAGSQILHVDTAGIIRVFVEGAPGAHGGDGANYNTPGSKISEVRSIALDRDGNMLITENDAGFVRKIRFLRQTD